MRRWALIALLLTGCMGGGGGPAHLSTGVRDLRMGQVVSGVPCLADDLPEHHMHVWLQVFLDGSRVVVPTGIGVGRPWGIEPGGFLATGSCFAWIHTHDASGIVHIATQEEETFTLGQLFDIWGQPLGGGSTLGYHGQVAVVVNGRKVGGDPRNIALVNLETIVLELGRPPSAPIETRFDGAMRS